MDESERMSQFGGGLFCMNMKKDNTHKFIRLNILYYILLMLFYVGVYFLCITLVAVILALIFSFDFGESGLFEYFGFGISLVLAYLSTQNISIKTPYISSTTTDLSLIYSKFKLIVTAKLPSFRTLLIVIKKNLVYVGFFPLIFLLVCILELELFHSFPFLNTSNMVITSIYWIITFLITWFLTRFFVKTLIVLPVLYIKKLLFNNDNKPSKNDLSLIKKVFLYIFVYLIILCIIFFFLSVFFTLWGNMSDQNKGLIFIILGILSLWVSKFFITKKVYKVMRAVVIFIFIIIILGFAYWSASNIGLIPAFHQVKGKSMLPTLKSGEYISCNTYNDIRDTVNYGDIIVFKYKSKVNKVLKDTDYIKRVIALPGDTINIVDQEVYLNSKKLNETYIQTTTNLWEGGFTVNGVPAKVPINKLFVMGDNREHSSDSREFGFVSKDDISCVIPWEKQEGYKNRWKTSIIKQHSGIIPTIGVVRAIITITPTVAPTITPIPTIDVNPIIECKISSECGGGIKQLSVTDCAKSSCCQIGTVWIFYYDRNKCLADQESHYNELVKLLKRYPTFNIPTLAPLPTMQPLQRYSPSYLNTPLVMPTIDVYQMYKLCVKNATDSYNARVAPLFAGGLAESSMTIEAQVIRDQDIGTCQRIYRY